MADNVSQFTAANLDKAIRQVEMKLARQRLAISDSEAHLSALRQLSIAKPGK